MGFGHRPLAGLAGATACLGLEAPAPWPTPRPWPPRGATAAPSVSPGALGHADCEKAKGPGLPASLSPFCGARSQEPGASGHPFGFPSRAPRQSLLLPVAAVFQTLRSHRKVHPVGEGKRPSLLSTGRWRHSPGHPPENGGVWRPGDRNRHCSTKQRQTASYTVCDCPGR